MSTRNRFICAAMIGLSSWAIGPVRASVISYAGEAANAGPGATIEYDSAGYDLYSTSPAGTTLGNNLSGPFSAGTRLTLLPAYITSITAPSSNDSFQGFSYATIDNPAGGQVEGGFTNVTNTSPGVQSDLVSLTIGAGAPATFYIGFLTNLDTDSSDYPDDIRLRQSSGGSGDSGLIATNEIPDGGIDDATAGVDVYFFEVTGATAGDVLTFSGIENQPNHVNTSDYLLMQGGTLFPGAMLNLPEPGSISLLLFAGVAVLRRRQPMSPEQTI